MNDHPSVLVVDDDESFRSLVADRLTRTGHRVAAAAGGEAALALLDGVEIAVVDLLMPGMDGLTLLRKIREANPDIGVLMLTGHGTIDTAVEAMKAGAADYLLKPCSLAEVELRIGQVWEKSRLRRENEQLRAVIRHDNPYQGIIGKSPSMQAIFEMIRKVKDSPSPVLIEGESGTGKELVARALHFDSSRRDLPFVAVNCATLQETLLESELFGHRAGAYTGATQDKRGLLEIADRGTLFVDEIGETHPNVQAKLLRVLETGEFRAVGDVKEKKVTVRLVAATNKNLRAEVAAGRFREDLFYRLNVVSLRLPPLRERGEDIALLARHYLLRKGRTIGDRALATLMGHSWPGNVRELFNTLERAVLFNSSGRIDAVEIPSGAGAPAPKDGTLEEVEVAHMKRVLESVQWNISRAAEILGTSRRNLHRKINQHNLKK
ncbi:MAG: sigma-54-dependent Fis family transcriptional regulator [Planctomycetaceae bacterium]|nr:sigma-54-dependent Fis family transcriptional regulator [Planctomycetaceae bacterium]